MTFDEEIAERFPDAALREKRRAVLLSRIDTFLSEDFVESDGGWAKVESPHISDLYDIIGEIIDLKVERDPDGDRTVELMLCNRRTHKLHSIFETNRPSFEEKLSSDETIEWLNKAQQEASYAMSVANRLSENIKFELQFAVQRVAKAREYKKTLRECEAKAAVLSLEEISNLLIAIQDSNNISSTYSDFESARAIVAGRFPKELEAAIQEILKAMEPYTSDNGEYFGSRVRQLRVRYGKIFGRAFSNDDRVADRSKQLDLRGREERAALRPKNTD